MTTEQNDEWNDIKQWLQSLNYGNYADLFQQNGYDLWEIMYEVTVEDLKDIGIKPGHAKRIHTKLLSKKGGDNNNNGNELQSSQSQSQSPIKLSSLPSSASVSPTKESTDAMATAQAVLIAQQEQERKAMEEKKRKIRQQLNINRDFAGNLKNKMYETMTRVLNGLQQELIQYNGRFAEPINEMNQRIVALQRLDSCNLEGGIWDSNEGLFEPMMKNLNDINTYNNCMWTKMNQYHTLAEKEIQESIKSLKQQMNNIHDMKHKYNLTKQNLTNSTSNNLPNNLSNNLSNLHDRNMINPSNNITGNDHTVNLLSQIGKSNIGNDSSAKVLNVHDNLKKLLNNNNNHNNNNIPSIPQIPGIPIVSNVKLTNLNGNQAIVTTNNNNNNNNNNMNNNINNNNTPPAVFKFRPNANTGNLIMTEGSLKSNSLSQPPSTKSISIPTSIPISNGDSNISIRKNGELDRPKLTVLNTSNIDVDKERKNKVIIKQDSSDNDVIMLEKKYNKYGTPIGRKPAYTAGEIQMMKTFDKKNQTVADIIELQRRMQSIYGIPRSAYGIAQKMYRMGVLSATLPKKLQALQDKPDADKIKIGDSKGRGRKRRRHRNHHQNGNNGDDNDDSDDSYYTSSVGSSSDESGESDDDHHNVSNNRKKTKSKSKSKQSPNNTSTTSTISDTASNSSVKVLNINLPKTSSTPKISVQSLLGFDHKSSHRVKYMGRNGSSSSGSDSSISSSTPSQRKPPKLTRKYTAEEVNYIRKLIEETPSGEPKAMFKKFRQKFTFWKDDTESYTKFYQKKWRLNKEIDALAAAERRKLKKQQEEQRKKGIMKIDTDCHGNIIPENRKRKRPLPIIRSNSNSSHNSNNSNNSNENHQNTNNNNKYDNKSTIGQVMGQIQMGKVRAPPNKKLKIETNNNTNNFAFDAAIMPQLQFDDSIPNTQQQNISNVPPSISRSNSPNIRAKSKSPHRNDKDNQKNTVLSIPMIAKEPAKIHQSDVSNISTSDILPPPLPPPPQQTSPIKSN